VPWRSPQAAVAAALGGAVLVLLAVGLGGGCAAESSFRPGAQHLVALVASQTDQPAQRPDSLLVVSYNIQYGEDVGVALADLRAAGLDRADILLVQEMGPDGVDTLSRALGLHAVYHPASFHPHHDRPFGNAVLSRWPITGSRLLVLPHPHPWTGHRRIAVAADLDVAGQPLRTVSLHVATPVLSPAARLEQATAVLDTLVAGWDGPLVVGGDFNTSLRGDYAALRKRYRRQARLLPVPPTGCTVRWHPARLVGARCILDHLFLRGLVPGRHGVARQAAASDHFPVWARVGWTEAGR